MKRHGLQWQFPLAVSLMNNRKLAGQIVQYGERFNAFNYAEPHSEGPLLVIGSPFQSFCDAMAALERAVRASIAK